MNDVSFICDSDTVTIETMCNFMDKTEAEILELVKYILKHS